MVGWSTFPSRRRKTSLWLFHSSLKKVRLWEAVTKGKVIWQLIKCYETQSASVCRRPLVIWQCAAGAELCGFEWDPAGAPRSCYIRRGVCRAQKLGICKASFEYKPNCFNWFSIEKIYLKHISGFTSVFQTVTMAGDGYRGRTSPHTPNEKFEGATVLKTLQVHWL